MSEESGARRKGAGAWGQAVTAVALVGAIGAALFVFRHTHADDAAGPPRGVTCADSAPAPSASPYLSGTQMCHLLLRPDLTELLGTPGEAATSVTTSGSTPPTSDKGLSGPYAQVSFPTYTVNLAATYHNVPMAEEVRIFGADARQRRVLGHPAFSYADRAVRLRFGTGSTTSGGTGAPVTVLSVAMDPQGSGRSFEVTLWHTDATRPPDDTTLLHLAEALLPTLPGWTPTP